MDNTLKEGPSVSEEVYSSAAVAAMSSPQVLVSTLQHQLDAMNEAFALQEKALEQNGADAAEYALGLTPFPRRAAPAATGSLQPFQHSPSDYAKEKELIAKFPYYRLLQMWRKKALTALLHSQRLQKEMNEFYRVQREDRSKHQQEHKELECQVMKWKTRTHVLDEQLKVLATQLQKMESHIEQLQNQKCDSNDQVQLYQQVYHQLHDGLLRFCAQQDPTMQTLQQMSIFQHVTTRCRQYESQLQRLQRQVTRLTEHLVYQQIQHRNAQAVVEAERRLQQLRFVKQFPTDSHESSPAPIHNTTEAVAGATPEGKYLSDLQLTAEAESLFKALFQSLDCDGRGSVSRSLWTQALLRDEDTFRTLVASSNEAVISMEILSGYGRLLASAVSESVFHSFLHSLLSVISCNDFMEHGKHKQDDKDNVEEDVCLTWGELLLHLVPDPSDNRCTSTNLFRSPLSDKEWRDLQKEGIWHRYDLGLLPLQLPSDHNHLDGAVVSDKHISFSSSTKETPNSQWNFERAALMRRLQDHLTHETRLIENVKAYFERELRQQHLQQQRMINQQSSLQEQVKDLQTRWQQATASLSQQQQVYETKMLNLQSENEQLTKQLDRFQDHETRRYESLLQEQQAKYSRLEKEHQVLQREQSKKDVKIKALERDVLRLQSAQTVSLQEMQTMRESLQEQVRAQRQDAEHQRLAHLQEKTQWEEEKSELLKKLAATQEELLTLCRAPPVATIPESSAENKATVPVAAEEKLHREEVPREEQPHVQSTLPVSQYMQNAGAGVSTVPQHAALLQPQFALPPSAALSTHSFSQPAPSVSGLDSQVDAVPLDHHSTQKRPGNLHVYGAHLDKLLQIMDNLFDGTDT